MKIEFISICIVCLCFNYVVAEKRYSSTGLKIFDGKSLQKRQSEDEENGGDENNEGEDEEKGGSPSSDVSPSGNTPPSDGTSDR